MLNASERKPRPLLLIALLFGFLSACSGLPSGVADANPDVERVIHSGRTATFGHSLAALEGPDGESILAIGYPFADDQAGVVLMIDLETGLLHQATSGKGIPDGVWRIGARLIAVGDADGDGWGDLVVFFASGKRDGCALISGATGEVLYRRDEFAQSALWIHSMARGGAAIDFDQDGIGDFCAFPSDESEPLTVYSGATGEAIARTGFFQSDSSRDVRYSLELAGGTPSVVALVERDAGMDDVELQSLALDSSRSTQRALIQAGPHANAGLFCLGGNSDQGVVSVEFGVYEEWSDSGFVLARSFSEDSSLYSGPLVAPDAIQTPNLEFIPRSFAMSSGAVRGDGVIMVGGATSDFTGLVCAYSGATGELMWSREMSTDVSSLGSFLLPIDRGGERLVAVASDEVIASSYNPILLLDLVTGDVVEKLEPGDYVEIIPE